MADPFENISPLPVEIRHGLIVMSCIGVTSFVVTILLFMHITFKLVQWKIRDIRSSRQQLELLDAEPVPRRGPSIDLNMGLAEDHYYRAKGKSHKFNDPEPSSSQQGPPSRIETPIPLAEQQRTMTSSPPASTCTEKPPNPLLLLIYNLLLADISLSMAYVCDIRWLVLDSIYSPSPLCTMQGFIVGFGCLTTSGFLFAISIFSYLGIIRGYKATTRDVLIACCIVWLGSVILACLGPMYYHDQSLYGRETMWCWISEERKLWRLTVYVWGFSAMCLTMAIYTTIFYRLYREGRSSRFMPRRRRGSESTQLSASRAASAAAGGSHHNGTALRPSGHHPAFLIYPCIYSLTGTPLILGSLIPVLERNVYFMTVAGSLFAMTGLLDTLLWSSIILFSKKEDLAITGLDQFSFVRTPEGRTLGNIVLVQGGGGGGQGGGGEQQRRTKRQSWQSKKEKGWWRLKERNSNGSQISISRAWNADCERGNGYGIQMEVVTSVVVEDEVSRSATRNASRHRQMSIDSLK